MNRDYLAYLKRLFQVNLTGGVKLGLETMQALDAALGHPSRQYATVHVAGTNGKGSVSWKVAAALRSAGYSVGLFSSPHIATFRERIRVADDLITEDEVVDGLSTIFAECEKHSLPATFFEVTAALAFLVFARREVDIAVIEVGLGGRLDATNIVDPVVAAITSIDYDHCDILGNTLEEIAREKAGIIKPESHVVLGATVPAVVDAIAKGVGCSFERLDDPLEEGVHPESSNRAVAEAILRALLSRGFPVTDEQAAAAVCTLPPCRYEKLHVDGVDIIFDVAHNPAGLRALVERVTTEYGDGPFQLVIGLGTGKDVQACFEVISASQAVVTVTQGAHPRVTAANAVLEAVEVGPWTPQYVSADPVIASAIHAAIAAARSKRQPVVVCGSFFIMADAFAAVGVQMERDPLELNEMTMGAGTIASEPRNTN